MIPCLNEEGSIAECILKIHKAFAHCSHEILIIDNGSGDRSKQIALEMPKEMNVQVFDERRQGYGSAILRGLKEASGKFIVIGDADNTYDFEDGRSLVEELEKGAEFAIGDRIRGKTDTGAMPWLHQHIGTPALSWILSRFFGKRVHDINCGLRAIRREVLSDLRLRATGMEFASEMVIHAQKAGLRFSEVPIRYYRRHHGQAKLRTFRDGWRHLRFILLCAPFPLFVLPALALIALSVFFFQNHRLGFQALGSLTSIIAVQLLIFAIFAKAYLWVADSFMLDRKIGNFLTRFQLEYGILTALVLFGGGVIAFQYYDIANLMRGSTLIAISVQIFFSSFFLSIILSKRDPRR